MTGTVQGDAKQNLRVDPGIDLLDLRPHYVEGRIGLRMSLVWIVGISITSLFLLHPQVPLSMVVSLMIAGFAIAVAALVLPVRGVQQRIHHAKLAALASVDGELRRARDAALSGEERAGGTTRRPPRLPQLHRERAGVALRQLLPLRASASTC